MNDLVSNFVRMPWPLRILTLLSLVSMSFVGVTLLPGAAVVVGQKTIAAEVWWSNGSGLALTVAVCFFFSAGILLLCVRRLGRLVYILGFVGLYVAGYFIETINGVSYSRRGYIYDLAFLGVQLAALSAYLFLSQRVEAFLSSRSVPNKSVTNVH